MATVTQAPVLNLELALDRVGGDAGLLKEIADLFLIEYPRLMAELHQAYEQRDAYRVERAAHGLKGSVANFGSSIAADAAYKIELLGRDGSLDPVAEALHSLDLILLALHGELAAL